MREYIHLFEDSSQRDAYENGSDYIEPYVSYTPVINRYEAQFNGEPTPISFLVRKPGDLYQISSDDVNLNSIDGKVPFVSVESNSVYLDTSGLPDDIFVFPEDLNLNEESTEFTFNGNIYYLVYDTLNNNIWYVYRDSEHTKENGTIVKIDIVSVPSSSNDFVHYNKITPERITAKFIVVSDYATKDAATLNRKVAEDGRLFDQIYINGTPIFDQPEEEIPTRRYTDYSVYHTFEEEGTYDIEYVLRKEYAGTIPEGIFPPYQYFSEIIIPKGVTTIKTGAFSHISNYPYTTKINVIIPNTIILVEDDAVGCSNLNSSTIQKFISINPNSIYTGACEK